MPFRFKGAALLLVSLTVLTAAAYALRASAQSSPTRADDAPESQASAKPEPVVIHREGLRLINPKTYRVLLRLEPIRSVTLLAPTSGVVEMVEARVGQKVASQYEIVRLDSREQRLLLDRANALRRAAEIELRRARKGQDPDLVELAEAKLDAAKADEQLAELRLERMQIRAPFEGRILRVYVTTGESVAAGDRLLEIADTSRLQVELPVDRREVKPGGTVEITIDEKAVQAKVERLVPLADRFEPLLDLVPSLTSAVVVLDNPGGRYQVGQAVRLPIIPESYVVRITNEALVNMPDGRRKVQVVRHGVVRDVPIRLLAQAGPERSYVTGAFVPGDEIITSSSKELPDGTQVRPLATAAAEAETDENVPAPKRSSSKTPGF